MNGADIDAAFAAGRIDRPYRAKLRGCLQAAARLTRAEPMVQSIIERARVVQHACPIDAHADVLRSLESIPGAEHRPGTVALFRAVHAGGMLNVADDAELEKVETLEQLHAMVRVETQAALASAIRAIWQPMQEWFNQTVIVIPRGRHALRVPTDAEGVTHDGVELAGLPMSPAFGQLFGCETASQTLALLKRAIERMGRHFTTRWYNSKAGRQPEFATADRLLRLLRNVDLVEILCNGFSSGAADVLNPLHNMVLDIIERHGCDVFTAELQQTVTSHHEDFSVFLATFSLPCLAVLEDVLREPASPGTIEFLSKWTQVKPDFGGKGFTLDCEYNRKYFTVRYLDDDSTSGIPLVDFDFEAFRVDEFERMGSRIVRLGCPSLGTPHRAFTRVLCGAYFAIVLPKMLEEAGVVG